MLLSGLGTIALILGAMVVIAGVEALIPLHFRGRWNRAHLAPNLALTCITFATNIVFNVALVAALVWADARRVGLLHRVELSPLLAGGIALVVLDFSFYVCHVAMHRLPSLWRFHQVHHSDPAVDVTTTIRQHPGEGVIRYVFMAAFGLTIGATPGAFALYRSLSAINGLLEHANISLPQWLDGLLALVTTWPNLHKIHHSRSAAESTTNYGNIFSLFDRALSTFTPAARGRTIQYGVDGLDQPALQTTAGLLWMPFRRSAAWSAPGREVPAAH